MKIAKTFFDAIQLNLGIKRFFSVFFSETRLLVDKGVYAMHRLLGKWLYKRLVWHYGADYRWDEQESQNLDTATQNYGYGSIHYSLTRNQRPRRVLAIGSMYGFIPFMLAKACEENRFGHVDFVDAGFDMHDEGDAKQHIFGQGFWRRPEAENHFSYLLDSSRITFYRMKTADFAKKFPRRKYDYIYLDGDHRYRGAKADFKAFWPRLKEGGYMAIHDIHFDTTAGGIYFEMWKLWEELVKKYPYKIELYNEYSGLGIVQKLTRRPKRFQEPLDLGDET